jgi:hypothetical protein
MEVQASLLGRFSPTMSGVIVLYLLTGQLAFGVSGADIAVEVALP